MISTGYGYGSLRQVESAEEEAGTSFRHVGCIRVPLVASFVALVCVILLSLNVNDGGRHSTLVQSLAASDQLDREMFLQATKESYPEEVSKDMNFSVDPCQNFYEHACGGWIARAEIPSYMSAYDRSFTAAQVETRRRLRELYTADYPAGSPFTDLRSFYSACMNTTAIDALGAAPARDLLRRIDAIETEADLAGALAAMWAIGFSPFFKLDGAVGLANRSEKVLTMKAGAFALESGMYTGWPVPDEEDWDSPDADLAEFRNLSDDKLPYRTALARFYRDASVLCGYGEEEAERWAVRAVWTEATLAMYEVQEQSTDHGWGRTGPPQLNLTGLAAVAPHVPWRRLVEESAAACARWNTTCGQSLLDGAARVLLFNPDFARRLSDDLGRPPASRWRPFLRARLLHVLVPQLSEPFQRAGLELNRRIYGVTELTSRETQCVQATTHGLPWLSDPLYVATYLPSFADNRGLRLLRAVRGQFVSHMAEVGWLDDATRARAVAKAERMEINLGSQPLEDYLAFTYPVSPTDHFTNAQYSYQTRLLKLLHYVDTPIDRRKWGILASTVNAEYDNGVNGIFVPAAMMQAPFFSASFRAAQNFGGIGAVVGHEMTHGFDSTGREFDEDREMRDWWDPDVVDRFKTKATCVSRLYSGFSEGGASLDGNRTLAENIADFGGARIAYDAFVRSHREKSGAEPPEDEQRLYFVSFAQMWCSKVRPSAGALHVRSDRHSPGLFRANGVVSQNPDFARLFRCPAGSAMNPRVKCVVWEDAAPPVLALLASRPAAQNAPARAAAT